MDILRVIFFSTKPPPAGEKTQVIAMAFLCLHPDSLLPSPSSLGLEMQTARGLEEDTRDSWGRCWAHLLLNAAIEPPQCLLEVLVPRLEGGTALHVLEGLVQLPQVLQRLASPVQSLDV